MQPVVQATTRTPGPSTVEPVVKECRKPMCPAARAERTSDSGTSLPRSTRSSYGLFASRDGFSAPMEGPVDDVHLLLAAEAHEVHGVAGNPDGQVGILLRVIHGVHQRFAVQDVDIHMIARAAEEGVQH